MRPFLNFVRVILAVVVAFVGLLPAVVVLLWMMLVVALWPFPVTRPKRHPLHYSRSVLNPANRN